MLHHQVSNSLSNYNYNAFIYTDIIWNKHFHKNYELIYVFSGKITVCLNSNTIMLPEGSLLLISPFDIHYLDIDKKSSVWVAVFSEDYIRDFSKKYSDLIFSEFVPNEDVLEFLKKNLFTTVQTNVYTKKACLYAVCAQCLKYAVGTKRSRDESFVGSVIEYISLNMTENILMTDVAKHLAFESHYFSTLFHKYFGMNFREFLNMYRYDYACEIMISENLSVTETAIRSGFSSVRNFNRIFAKFSGITPSEFCKRASEKVCVD